ncbi:MAG: alpha/beta hydrolase [Lachnospiraceae bacterium]|nr:alpha/beta hydrolase [Lachnospiraceae bacterium]
MDESAKKKQKHPGRRFMIIFLIVVLVFLPVSNAVGYEVVFHVLFTDTMRDIEKNEAEEAIFLAENGLARREYTIEGTKGKLQGYLYMKNGSETADCTDMIVFSHGIGNGHIAYLSWIGEFMKLPDTCVFTYDATGNGRSDGNATGGLPQGVKDLDSVLNFIESDEKLAAPEITLVGHSWGAFSAGSVLEFHPEIKQAALFCGFNASENMLQTYAQKYAGPVVYLFLPYVELYEMIKFGKYGNASIVRGCLQSGARVIFTQPLDDKTVDPQKFGIKYLEKELSDDEETTFIELPDGGHTPPKEVVMESLHRLRRELGKE